MATLNRFPLLGLWAREAAHRIGYPDREADVLGHAYAVLYAIRANTPTRRIVWSISQKGHARRSGWQYDRQALENSL